MRKLTKEEFISKAKQVHGDIYDYSKADYTTARNKITILCKQHGAYQQLPANHLNLKQGCPKCSRNSLPQNTPHSIEKVIESFIRKHGYKYDYSRMVYINNKTKICIICKEHGEFWQTPSDHKKGYGCVKCSNMTTEKFISKAKSIHGDLYDYSKTRYTTNQSETYIICSIHGEFLQTPNIHLRGSGCPKCKSSKGELEISSVLMSIGESFIPQHTFGDCRYKNPLPFDFYLTDLNACIEFDGEQHTRPIGHFGGENRYIKQKLYDSLKEEYCKNNNIPLLRIAYKHRKNIKELVLTFIKEIRT